MLEILSKVGFDWQVALANFVNFIVIFIILKKFAFGPIFKIIRERQQKIDLGLEETEKAKKNLLVSEEASKEHLSKAKKEANAIILKANEQRDEIINQSKIEAESLKTKIIKDGQEQIETKKNSIQKDVEKETSELIINGIEKILRNNLSQEQEKKYIENFLSN